MASSDFFTQYKNLPSKLKKKFLRKTNVEEPSDQFAKLAAECERSELPEYAALSWRAVSCTEASQGHTNGQAMALVKSSQFFLKANQQSLVNCGEHAIAGAQCSDEAIKLLGDENPLSADICLQTADSLKDNDPYRACTYFRKACELLKNSPQLLLIAQGSFASLLISLGEHHEALNLHTDMVNTVGTVAPRPFGIYKDILVRCEVSRILLILLLKPTPQNISPDLAKLVEKYTWIEETDTKTTSWLGEELFFLLKSLVMSCQCQDLEGVKHLEGDLWKYMSLEQRELLTSIILDMNNSER